MRSIPSPLPVLLLSFALFSSAAIAIERSFAVIVGPGVTEHHLTRESVSSIFKRKQNHWHTGLRIQPVNLPSTNPLRRLFSQTILGAAPEAFEDYWHQMYFQGELPPHVVASEEAVILFVNSTPGAIGYISGCIPIGRVNVALMVGGLPMCVK